MARAALLPMRVESYNGRQVQKSTTRAWLVMEGAFSGGLVLHVNTKVGQKTLTKGGLFCGLLEGRV